MTTKPTKKPVKKGPPFGYGTPSTAKQATTPTLKTALAKIDMPSLTKVVR